MKQFLSLVSVFTLSLPVLAQQSSPAAYVNPFIGTAGHGHTFPGATVPFGMIQLSPDTRVDGSWDGSSGYHYSDNRIFGFSHTHLSGTGVSDYGDILLMPMLNKHSFNNQEYAASFSHEDETASPGYYSVKIRDKKIAVELTASERTGFHRYTFSESGRVCIILDLTHRDKTIRSEMEITDNIHVTGLRFSEGWAKDQRVFFSIEFSKPCSEIVTESLSEITKQETKRYTGNVKAAFYFQVKKGESILVKCALSAVDERGALLNMQTEIPHWNFEKIKTQAFDSWNKELSRIEVKTGNEKQKTIFYTALYHCMIAPNIYNDVDNRFLGRDMKIHQADGFNYYTVFSLWDTFRALHPLLNLINKQRSFDFIQTLILQYMQGGLLPVWELASNETECMIGYHSVPVIADAAVTGIDFNLNEALQAMKASAEAWYRFGLRAYIDNGFLSIEDEHESVSKTLEYAYDDWCIGQLALIAGDTLTHNQYMKRAQSWKNLFDPETGFIRPRQNGDFLSPFDPSEVNNNFTEANAWQYTFFVPQDIKGLADKMGGDAAMEKKLDALFTASEKTSGRKQVDITGLIGQYAHGNEPSHHVAYLYNYCAAPEKTQFRVRQIMNEFYTDKPDGLIGNEDCGQMSAWYVMSAMGFYPVTPASGMYALGSPLFDEVKINLENGKSFTIRASQNSSSNKYIQSALLNGEPYSKSFILYDHIKEGGELNLAMGSIPDNNFGKSAGDFPVQHMLEQEMVLAPLIKTKQKVFADSVQVRIQSLETDQAPGRILYSVESGNKPVKKAEYQVPFYINITSKIKATAFRNNGRSGTVTAELYKLPNPAWTINYIVPFSSQYAAGGSTALIDGIRGDANWRKGNWQGFVKDNMGVILDLGKEQKISKVTASFLQDTRSWIYLPLEFSVQISTDTKTFTDAGSLVIQKDDKNEEVIIRNETVTFNPVSARYIKIRAINYGKLPEWHPGFIYNGQAWIFCDEISVE